MHLRVGDVARAETFYRDALGLDVTRRRHGATFMSSGRYHHHIAGNVWHSAGAGRRDENRAGLSWLSLEAADAAAFDAVKARLAQAGVKLDADGSGSRDRRPVGHAPAHHARVVSSRLRRRRQRTHPFQRLGGERAGQVAGRQRAAERGRLPRPHR